MSGLDSTDVEPMLPTRASNPPLVRNPRLSVELDNENRARWRIELGEILEMHAIEWCIIALIVLDVICVLFEILEHVGWMKETHTVESFCTVLAWTSRSILIIFALEIALKITAFGRGFLRSFWHCFDFFVVFVCIGVETADYFLTSGHAKNEAEHEGNDIATGLLAVYVTVLVFRFLRIIHVFHDLYEINSKFEEERIKKILRHKDVEIQELILKLHEHGIEL